MSKDIVKEAYEAVKAYDECENLIDAAKTLSVATGMSANLSREMLDAIDAYCDVGEEIQKRDQEIERLRAANKKLSEQADEAIKIANRLIG